MLIFLFIIMTMIIVMMMTMMMMIFSSFSSSFFSSSFSLLFFFVFFSSLWVFSSSYLSPCPFSLSSYSAPFNYPPSFHHHDFPLPSLLPASYSFSPIPPYFTSSFCLPLLLILFPDCPQYLLRYSFGCAAGGLAPRQVEEQLLRGSQAVQGQ